MWRIRPSTPEDGKRVISIWRDAVDVTHDFLSPEDRIAIEKEVVNFLPSAPLWLATDTQGYAVGFMLLDNLHMEALFIDPAYRGQGVDLTLVKHAQRIHAALTTDVNEQNLQAVGFYQHLGFVPTGRSDLDGQGRAYPLVHLRLS